MNINDIKNKLDALKATGKTAEFTGFVCPQCGEISEKISVMYDGTITHKTSANKQGDISDESDEYSEDDFINWVGDCDCENDKYPEDYIVRVFEKNGKIYVEAISKYLLDNMEELEELIDDCYGEFIEVVKPEFGVALEEDVDGNNDEDVLKNWKD